MSIPYIFVQCVEEGELIGGAEARMANTPFWSVSKAKRDVNSKGVRQDKAVYDLVLDEKNRSRPTRYQRKDSYDTTK